MKVLVEARMLVEEGENSGSVLEEPGTQSGAEVGHAGGVVGEWARWEAVRARRCQ
jgi:hypothetical protein